MKRESCTRRRRLMVEGVRGCGGGLNYKHGNFRCDDDVKGTSVHQDMNTTVAKKTQEMLGKVTKKAPLTEALLSRPPFRYLHDIITEVIRTTGFLKGLYEEHEMKSFCLTDKDSRMAFFQKAIDVVVLVTGKPLAVKPSRIVSGLQPEKTNELLQAIATCCINKMSSDKAVKRLLSGDNLDTKTKASNPKSRDKENEEGPKRHPDREETKKITERRDKRDKKDLDQPKEQGIRRRDGDKERHHDKHQRSEQDHRAKSQAQEREQQRDRDQDKGPTKAKDRREREKSHGPASVPRPSSAKRQRKKPQIGGQDESDSERVVKKTQEMLGKVTKKAPLTEALLSRPPFRYLHDIVTEVIRTTGFLKGLYEEHEMKSFCLTDKDSRMAFFQKAIDVVVLVTGKPLAARPSNILSGLEPEKTNELLQAIATCCINKMSSDKAVKRLLSGDNLDTKTKASNPKSRDKENEEGPKHHPDREETKKITERRGKRDKKDLDQPKEQGIRRRDGDKERHHDKHQRSEQDHRAKSQAQEREQQRDRDQDKGPTKAKDRREREKSHGPASVPRPSSAKRQRKPPQIGGQDESDSERVVKKTQEMLGKVTKKAPLTEALLSRPPFRYLHDIITEVIRTTGFLKGLYEEHEMKSFCLTDKDSRMAFFQKAIDVVVLVTGKPLAVKPSRIVSGLQPEKTNELLQAIATCCINKMSSDKAVKRVLSGDNLDTKTKASNPKSRDKENEEGPEHHPDRESHGPASVPRPSSAKRQRKTPQIGGQDESDSERDGDAQSTQRQVLHENGETGKYSVPSDMPSSRPTPRPSSARPAPPRDKSQESYDDTTAAGRLSSAKLVTQVILDGEKLSEDEEDDEQILVEAALPHSDVQAGPAPDLNSQEQHGGLVKMILETKKEYESSTSSPKPEGQNLASEVAQKKQRDMVKSGIERLRSSIQMFSLNCSSLEKLLNYSHEDVETIQAEFQSWRQENKDHAQALLREQRETDRVLNPLKAELAELEQQIKDQQAKNRVVKANILQNDEKIKTMVTEMSSSRN